MLCAKAPCVKGLGGQCGYKSSIKKSDLPGFSLLFHSHSFKLKLRKGKQFEQSHTAANRNKCPIRCCSWEGARRTSAPWSVKGI